MLIIPKHNHHLISINNLPLPQLFSTPHEKIDTNMAMVSSNEITLNNVKTFKTT